jgi:hypothetical protein
MALPDFTCDLPGFTAARGKLDPMRSPSNPANLCCTLEPSPQRAGLRCDN